MALLGKLTWSVLIGSACVGCTLQATRRTEPVLAPVFERASPSEAANWPSKDWFRGFASPELDALMAEATASNFDLATARSRVT
jgi:multidrug efflux system outer membrane protein